MKRTWSQANADEYGQLGIIECVKLRNFMCHDNLSFEFDPHMNFIIGRNGSGKSAVLTAVILALGGKSGATGRYSNIKGFVKNGKNSATVSVTLKNCGPDAYKPDDYGERITIERNFTIEGVSTYRLKSEAGRLVSNSKEDLINILDVMDIQIENPITVLTQEISRSFLVSKNSKGDKLFQLFYQGTGLKKLHDSYNISVQQNKDAKAELANKKAVLPAMEKDIKTIKSLLDKSAKVTDLKKELMWSLAIEFEKIRDEELKGLEELREKESVFTRKLNTYEAELANVDQNIHAAEADKKTADDKMKSVRKDMTELTNKRNALKSEIREIQGTVSRHEREMKKFDGEILSLKNIMHEIQKKNQDDLNEDKLRYEMSLKNLKNQITNTTASIGMLENKKSSLRETANSLQKQIETCQAEVQEVSYEKSRILKEKQQLVEGMKSRINVFGPEMFNVLKEIKAGAQAGIFNKEPKGPIGLHVNVKQSEWNFAVQECLRVSLLKTFVCDNHADAEVLTKIFNKHFQRQRPSIIISKFVPVLYDVSAHKSISNFPTVLDMLNIDDPVIANCLIDQKSIENILLIADQREARNLMLYNPPEKCLNAYTMNGDLFCHSPFRKYSCRNKNQLCLLKTVNEDDIRIKDEEIRLLDMKESKKTAFKVTILQQLKLNEQEIDKCNNEITELKIKQSQYYMKLKDEENSYSEPKDVNILQTDMEELTQNMQYHKQKYESCSTILMSKSSELDILDQNIEECRRILDIELSDYYKLSEKFSNLENSRVKIDSSIKKIRFHLENLRPVLEEKEKCVADHESNVKIAIERAQNTCPRINTRKTSDTIRQQLHEMEKLVKQQKNCDRDALLKEYEEKVEKLNKAKSELLKLERLTSRLDRMVAVRFQEFNKICKNTSVSLTCAFTALLSENNFYGYPSICYESNSLEIFAKPTKTKAKLGNKHKLSQLSGGERSYVTIAFLLSLWDRIHSPFRILDEYDVFMDSNNRHLSIHLIINTARSNKKIQYIFLSPLELPHIEDSDHVKVHKMPSPRE